MSFKLEKHAIPLFPENAPEVFVPSGIKVNSVALLSKPINPTFLLTPLSNVYLNATPLSTLSVVVSSPRFKIGSVILTVPSPISPPPSTIKLPAVNVPFTVRLRDKSTFPLTSNVPYIIVLPVSASNVKVLTVESSIMVE